MTALRTESVTAPDAKPEAVCVFLHGILGSGANLRTLAKRFVQTCPRYQVMLVDLRAHGGSLNVTEGEDSIEGAADDVRRAAVTWGLPVEAVVGHSFGGKVALSLARPALSHLKHVVTIDSGPGVRGDFRGSETTAQVLTLLEQLPGPWPTRDAFVADFEARGLTRGVAQWLAMSVARDGAAFRFMLDLHRIRALLESYGAWDAWPVLEARGGVAFHLVIGDRSEVYDAADRARAMGLERAGRVTVDVLPAGHWVHVDDFEGLLKVLATRLGV